MRSEPVVDDPYRLAERIAQMAPDAKTIDELAQRIREEADVVAVVVQDYLVKTEPPRHELVVTLRTAQGSVVRRVADVAVDADQTLRFAGLHRS